MDIFFVALNAPHESNKNEHWFSRNLSFWNVLYNSGVITQPIFNKLEGDLKVFGDTSINYKKWSFGVTDLNRRDVETNSSNVKASRKDVDRILEIIDSNSVSKLCLLHSKVGRAFRKYGSEISFNGNRYGIIGTYNSTIVFEVPFHNASIPNKEQYYKTLIS